MRDLRLASALRDIIAEFLAREMGGQSLVTVTRVEVAPNEKDVTAYLTVLPREKEAAALGFATRNAGDLRGFIKTRLRVRVLPFITFVIDEGEKNRQRMDELSLEARKQERGE